MATEENRTLKTDIQNLKNLVKQQEAEELKACWDEIQPILKKYGAQLVPVVTVIGTAMQASVVVRKVE